MAVKLEIVRPDDLLNLQIEAENLRLEDGDPPALVVDAAARPAHLIFTFPPQTIAETAYFESSIVDPESDKPDPDAGTVTEQLDPPGVVNPGVVPPARPQRRSVAQIARPSRLAFSVPADVRITYTIEGLLDWSQLQPSLNPIAAIPPDPSAEQIAGAPAIRAPKPAETAIELPYRLIVSPNAEARWEHRTGLFTVDGRTELWHTRLQALTPDGPAELSNDRRAALRAIWAEGFKLREPPPTDAHDPDLGRTAMSANDRHQLVILTSAFHGFEVERELPFVLLQQLDRGAPARAAAALDPALRAKVRVSVPHVPEPFYAEQLMLSPLGGWLKSRGQWDPPHAARPGLPVFERPDYADLFTRITLPRAPGLPDAGPDLRGLVSLPAGWASSFTGSDFLLPGDFIRPSTQDDQRLDLSEWVHVAAQGRDHYVRIVYEGELWPFRNRAALIKVTERRFKEQNGIVVAYQFQRMFIVVREPVKRFARDDRGMLLKQVRLTTLVTPDIAEPVKLANTVRSFWVEVRTGAQPADVARFKFHGVGIDVAGNEVNYTIPMMFVSIAETEQSRKAAAVHYNASGTPQLLAARGASVPGQKLMFAERDQASPTNTTELVTQALNFVMDAAGAAPALLKADVKIPQVQELLGTDQPTTIRLFKDYVDKGLDGAAGVFAEVVKEDFSKFKPDDPFAGLVKNTLGVNFSSDKAGGFATPNLGVSTLSRAFGPLAGDVADAVADQFDPQKFFGDLGAKLFGSFKLADLLPATPLGQNAPKMRTQANDIPGGKLIVTTLDWEPEVKNLDLGVAAFEKTAQTQLRIHGVIQKPVKLDSLGQPAADGVTYDFTGTLNDFRVSVLKAVYVNFVEFGFAARSNAKPDVRVKLDPAKPLEFAGDLQFVEELRKAIPPDLFGDGPSLDIAPTGIRAGFAFMLPPVAVGVFSLRDVSLGAALTLPFVDGKPTLDFNVSERQRPFLLSVSIFGGGGFFRLQLDTAGIKVVEAAFEFGATAALDIGVASGEVHIMAGIYFKLERKEPGTDLAPTLSGYLRMGGSLNVLGLIKISVEFNLSFTYDGARDKAYGRATLTVSIEIAFFSTSVELTVERAFGGQSGDPTFGELFDAPQMWNDYALAFA